MPLFKRAVCSPIAAPKSGTAIAKVVDDNSMFPMCAVDFCRARRSREAL